jgi:[ribosomal protein S5]-alanine N-acetyltransferase
MSRYRRSLNDPASVPGFTVAITFMTDNGRAAETQRLKLRRLQATDADFLLELLNQRSWIEFIGDRGVRTSAQACIYLTERVDAQFERYGFGMWGVELRDEPRLIGLVGLVKRDFLPDPDLGFALLDRYAGQGFAFEASGAVLSVARERGLTRLLAITQPDNERSIALLLRLGFELDESPPVTGDGKPVQRYCWAAR